MKHPYSLQPMRYWWKTQQLPNQPATVNDRNWAVFCQVAFTDDSVRQIGKAFGVSAERIRQIAAQTHFQLTGQRTHTLT